MEHLSTMHLSSSQIKVWTVKQWVQEGWPESEETSDKLQPYVRRKLELSVEGCVCCWGVGWWFQGKGEHVHYRCYTTHIQEPQG